MKDLTPAELLIIRHVIGGYHNKEIATLMNRSVRTIEVHRLNASVKMNARNRRDLFVRCREQGIEAL